jgi:hypothetical protein
MGKLRSLFLALRESWQHPTLGKILLGIAGLLVIVWFFRTPPPNYSIIAMAVAAGLMALRPDMSGNEKWLWAFMLMAFAIVEVRAIRYDRNIHDAEQAQVAKEQANHFQSIANGINQSIAKSDEHFDDTMSRVRSLLSLDAGISSTASKSLEQITGGGAFCFLVPTQFNTSGTTFDLSVGTSGKVLLPSCDVRIAENILPGPHRSYQMILRSPTRVVREDIAFAGIPTRPGIYAATCKVYSFEAKSVLLKDGCDTKRPK